MYLDEMQYSKDDVVVIYFFTPFHYAQILGAMIVLLVQSGAERSLVRTHTENTDCLFSTMFKMVQLLTNNPIKWVALTSVEVKNEWSCTSTPSLCIMA